MKYLTAIRVVSSSLWFLLSFNLFLGCGISQDWPHFFNPCENKSVWQVSGDIKFTKQIKRNDCWFACYSSLINWKNDADHSYLDIYNDLSLKWRTLIDGDSGLTITDSKPFCDENNLGYYYPQNFTFEGWTSMLTDHGPLWINMGTRYYNHARILYKIRCGRSRKKTKFYLFDPATNKKEKWSAERFFHHFEEEAGALVEDGLVDVDWRFQVIYIK